MTLALDSRQRKLSEIQGFPGRFSARGFFTMTLINPFGHGMLRSVRSKVALDDSRRGEVRKVILPHPLRHGMFKSSQIPDFCRRFSAGEARKVTLARPCGPSMLRAARSKVLVKGSLCGRLRKCLGSSPFL